MTEGHGEVGSEHVVPPLLRDWTHFEPKIAKKIANLSRASIRNKR